MQLTVNDVCRLMNVSERTVRRWVHDEQLPAYRVRGRYHFNRSELFEWATLRKLAIPTELLDAAPTAQAHYDTLGDSLSTGGIFYDLPGDDVNSALRSVVERMPLPEGFDREMLLGMFLSREHLGSTAAGDGIAIPHPRYPVVLSVTGPQVTLCFLQHPIDFNASDGRPVDTLFVMVSPTARWHSLLITQVAMALSNARFRELVLRKAMANEIVEASRAFHLAATNGTLSSEGTA
jgi:PTS system nitrogen regulatory IIA component